MLKKKQLNKEPFDTLFRLSRIASRSKNYIETNLIDEILLKKRQRLLPHHRQSYQTFY